MSYRKPVYLLAGGRSTSRETIVRLIQAVFISCETVSPTIAYVGTANDDDEGFFNRIAEVFEEAGAYRVNHALISSRKSDPKEAQQILKAADIVFVSGGDVYRGMCTLRRKNMTEFLSELCERGKPFFGSSAGTIMLAKKWVRWPDPAVSSTAELFPCLGIAPIICDTHDEQDGWQELKTVLRLGEDNIQGYGITTGAALKVFPDGGIEAFGGAIHQFVRRGQRVYRGPDILPICNRH
jgi:peptidase E